jgi:muramoyltetrapeptide carboxypeptidase
MKKNIFIALVVLILASCKSKLKIIESKQTATKIITKWKRPSNLKKGDTVMLLTPASYLKDSLSSIATAIDSLKSWGLHYKLGKHIFDRQGHFAGADTDRASDFQKAIDNPNIKAIWCTRGGYGSVRMIDAVDFNKLQQNPKWIIGYSDVTAIHNEIHNVGVQSIHGVMPVNFKIPSDKKIKAIKTFKKVLFGAALNYEIEGNEYNKTGTAEGVLVRGNLTLLHTMLGSTSTIDMRNKILFIEDVGEKKYRVDRMLMSLKRAGYFKKCNGVIVGSFTEAKALDILLILVDDYEKIHYPILPPDPIEAIKFRMEQMNLSRKDIEPYIGGRGRVSEILNYQRKLSLNMIRSLHSNLSIPLENLISEIKTIA